MVLLSHTEQLDSPLFLVALSCSIFSFLCCIVFCYCCWSFWSWCCQKYLLHMQVLLECCYIKIEQIIHLKRLVLSRPSMSKVMHLINGKSYQLGLDGYCCEICHVALRTVLDAVTTWSSVEWPFVSSTSNNEYWVPVNTPTKFNIYCTCKICCLFELVPVKIFTNIMYNVWLIQVHSTSTNSNSIDMIIYNKSNPGITGKKQTKFIFQQFSTTPSEIGLCRMKIKLNL